MSGKLTIALDAMGGDLGVDAVIPGAAMALKEKPDLQFLLFGEEHLIRTALSSHADLVRVSTIIHTDKIVAADEKPSVALRTGKESSMKLAIDSVSEGKAQAVVSSGNTGALMAMAKLALRCLPGIYRPAIASVLPSRKGHVLMLDLGANTQCDAETLAQFAVLGAVYAKVTSGQTPSVGILNIGSEDIKGNEEVRGAAAILSGADFPGRFHGFVEGNDIAEGTVDVVVTDGFTGNVALKVTEGIGKLTVHFLKEAFMSGILSRLGAVLAWGSLKRLKKRMDPRLYNGGMFLGLSGICIKSHGSSDALGFSRAVLLAANLVEQDYNPRVAEEIANLTAQKPEQIKQEAIPVS